MTAAFVRARGVGKLLGGRWAVRDVDLTWAQPGTLVVRGENGAGKSTLLRVVAGILAADAGDVEIAGRSLAKERLLALHGLGYAPDVGELPAHLRVSELVALVASLKRCAPPPAELVERLGVDALLGQRLGTLSLGQRRRACVLVALVGDPPLIVLDEPTNGLDPAAVELLVALLHERRARGRAALVASHDEGFVAAAADAVATMEGGRVRAERGGVVASTIT
ncbi:MAG TPA: ABC transporter ATP-binding protein [Byssovorax sp.]